MELRHKVNVTDRETTIIPIAQIDNAGNHKDGADAHLGTFRSRNFWQTTLGFSANVTITSATVSAANPTGLAVGTYPAWNFSTVESRGYPILRNHDGGILGGQ